MYLSSCCTLSAVAMAKPPKNKKMVGLAKACKADLVVSKPNSIAITGIESAVIVMCIASVSHKIATKAKRARPLLVSAG